MVRRRVIVHGRVQGVGFRYSIARAAQSRGVAGWARNRADGTLEAVFEGDPEAVEALVRLSHAGPGAAEDLELLATSAYMLGREDEWLQVLERAYRGHSEAAEGRRAVRCAFWIGTQLALRGEMGPATGWLGRAQRLLEREPGECVEHGYMLMPVVFQHQAQGDWEGASATAAAAAEIGERFGDADLFALAVHVQGDILVRYGRVREGLGLLDEAMVTVKTEALSAMVTGI